MVDVLEKMDPEKRESLINSALKEFGNNSFDKASTNVIVKDAGISKGLLYHYFSNKESLYQYLIDFFFSKSVTDMGKILNIDETDLFERMSEVVKKKLAYIKEYPYVIAFAKAFYKNHTMEDAKAIIDSYLPDSYNDFYTKNVDYTLFREGVDIPKTINIVQWTVEKLSENYADSLTSDTPMPIEVMFQQVEDYIGEMKKGFYKQT